MLYQIYDLCLYPIKLKDKRGEHGAGSGCQVPVCPVINMFCGCGNSRNVQGTSGDILFSSKAGAQLSPALMSPLLAHGDCRACGRAEDGAEQIGCLGAPGPCKIAPDRGYFHGRHCSMWTPPLPQSHHVCTCCTLQTPTTVWCFGGYYGDMFLAPISMHPLTPALLNPLVFPSWLQLLMS